jgi:SAM-dependent methyltransferase
MEAYGCDIFYDGNSTLAEDVINEHIKKMDDNVIPFEDNTFDVVVNNMVMEHVEDLDTVVREIFRVCKPGGVVLSLFPSQEVLIEGHCGIPIAHRFNGHSMYYWVLLWRGLGFGYNKAGKSRSLWSRNACSYLNQYTHYRSSGTIYSIYRNFFSIEHVEHKWFQHRLRSVGLSFIQHLLPTIIQRFIVRRIASLVFVARKL